MGQARLYCLVAFEQPSHEEVEADDKNQQGRIVHPHQKATHKVQAVS